MAKKLSSKSRDKIIKELEEIHRPRIRQAWFNIGKVIAAMVFIWVFPFIAAASASAGTDSPLQRGLEPAIEIIALFATWSWVFLIALGVIGIILIFILDARYRAYRSDLILFEIDNSMFAQSTRAFWRRVDPEYRRMTESSPR